MTPKHDDWRNGNTRPDIRTILPDDPQADAFRYAMDGHMQTPRESLIEANVNTWLGLAGSWMITYASFAWIDNLFWATNVGVAGCTVWSLARGYYIRRYFEHRQKRRRV